MQQFGLQAVATSAEGVVEPPPFNPAEQVGAIAPLGYFDPLGFTNVGDEAGFRKLREQELKHGRVAMMASIGLVAQHYVKWPVMDGVPSGVTAFTDDKGLEGLLVLAAV